MEITIRSCTFDDLVLLDQTLPVAGGHTRRFLAQLQGKAEYLVAVVEAEMAGHVMIRFGGSLHEHVRAVYPDVPEIGRLFVQPWCRRRGVGAELLKTAEAVAAIEGFTRVGLAVGVENVSAIEFYFDAGYEEASGITAFDSPFGIDADGESHSHVVTYLTKALERPVEVPDRSYMSVLT